MSDISLEQINSGYNLSKINANFDKIQVKINEELIHSFGSNNIMSQDLDMNGFSILNLDGLSELATKEWVDELFNNSVALDGSNPIQQELDMGGNSIVNVGEPVNSSSVARVKDVITPTGTFTFPVKNVSSPYALTQEDVGSFLVFNDVSEAVINIPDGLSVGSNFLATNSGDGGLVSYVDTDTMRGSNVLLDVDSFIAYTKIAETLWQASERGDYVTGIIIPEYNTTDFWDSAYKDSNVDLDQPNDERAFGSQSAGDSVLGTVEHSGSGKYQIHFEVQGFQAGSIQNNSFFGIADTSVDLEQVLWESSTGHSVGYTRDFVDGLTSTYLITTEAGTRTTTSNAGGVAPATPCTVDILVDLDSNMASFLVNGSSVGGSIPIPSGITWRPAATCVYQTGPIVLHTTNTFTPETGYKAWNQTN